jgi:hypothetical protein
MLSGAIEVRAGTDHSVDVPTPQQQQQQQFSLLSQASWGRLEMKSTENKNKKHKKSTSQRKS